jgi:hypothetical protein
MWMFLNPAQNSQHWPIEMYRFDVNVPPRIWIFESASTTRVLLAFSIACLVFPSFPAIPRRRDQRMFSQPVYTATLTANSSAEMLALECLDILDLESLNVQIIQTQQSNSVIQIETQAESVDKVCALLQSTSVVGESACAELDILVLGVDSALQLEVLNQGRVDLGPCVLQGSPAVRRYGDFAGFGADVGVGGLLGCE